MRSLRDESGAGSILVVAILAAVLGLSALSVPLYSVLAVKGVASGAADAAALAAADVAIGLAPGVPCVAAARIAEANGTVLSACQPDGLVVTVRVEAVVLGFTVGATATAGPAAEGP
ncbi:Rv3654c family TadE-like protein [Homoserinimonas sp. A447]